MNIEDLRKARDELVQAMGRVPEFVAGSVFIGTESETLALHEYGKHWQTFALLDEIDKLAARLDELEIQQESNHRSFCIAVGARSTLAKRLDALEQAVKDQARNSNAAALAFNDRLNDLEQRARDEWVMVKRK